MKLEIIPYNSRLKAYARQLRRNMTLAEVLLWKDLKGKKMLGYDFDRQRSLDEYVVDFYCKDLHLAIEIDGQSHDFKPDQDAQRQKRLERYGVHFLRFWDYQVKHDKGAVLKTIEQWIRQHEKSSTHP